MRKVWRGTPERSTAATTVAKSAASKLQAGALRKQVPWRQRLPLCRVIPTSAKLPSLNNS